MSLVINILLVLAGLLGCALLALVVVPLRAQAVGELNDESVRGAVVGSWGFGLIGVFAGSEQGVFLLLFGRPVWRIPPDSDETKAKKKAKKEKKQAKKKKRKKDQPSKRTARYWLNWSANHRSTAGRLIMRVLGTFALQLRVEGTVGLDDPADTAVLMTTLRNLERLADSGWLDVQPDYLDDTVDLAGEVSARLWILAILWVAVSSLFEIRTWKMLRGLM